MGKGGERGGKEGRREGEKSGKNRKKRGEENDGMQYNVSYIRTPYLFFPIPPKAFFSSPSSPPTTHIPGGKLGHGRPRIRDNGCTITAVGGRIRGVARVKWGEFTMSPQAAIM